MKYRQVFPYFGGKARVAEEVWSRFGRVNGYLEPFAGSLAVALSNPQPEALTRENLNDFDAFLCNFWRSVAMAPDEVAAVADWPVSQLDSHARHDWILAQKEGLAQMLAADMNYCDAEIAGVWVWGISLWIGSGWGKTPHKKRPHLGNSGMGAHSLGQRPHLGDHGRGGLYELYTNLAQRLRFSRMSCCDWTSLKSTLHNASDWGVFLDPPYTAESGRMDNLYSTDSLTLGHAVAEWAIEIGETHKVALCGLLKEYDMPDSWDVYSWNTSGYSYGDRDRQEVIWFSPTCQKAQGGLF